MNLKLQDKQSIASTYARFNLEITSGKGAICYDEKGKEYIDLTTGIGVNAFGFCDVKWQQAVAKQAGTLQHISNLYYTKPCVELANLLTAKSGMKKVFFGNSGAEANECAIKVARKYACEKHGKDCYKIITLENSFHGRTITTLSATGQDVFHKDFLPLTDGFIYAEPNNIESLHNAVESGNIAGIMFETVLGEGGVLPLEESFIKEIEKICIQRDILMIIDEVQTGNGRTGEMYSYMHFGLNPDIVSTAKGLGGGLPIGATLLGAKTAETLVFGDHGSTFGGNPVASAGAVSIIERMDDEFFAGVKNREKFIRESLENKKGINSITGLGLMIGIETDKDASTIIAECMNLGVLLLKAKNKVRMLPPLNIPFEDLKKALEIFISVCEKE
ncbi:MAG: acetylornithine/succinylornithine family transaminase [Bacillota bacterium]